MVEFRIEVISQKWLLAGKGHEGNFRVLYLDSVGFLGMYMCVRINQVEYLKLMPFTVYM